MLMLLAAVAVIAPGPHAGASVVYDNGPVNPVLGPFSDPDATLVAGDDFTLATAAIITDVHWFGLYSPFDTRTATTDNFTIRLFTMASSVPAQTPFFSENVGSVATTEFTTVIDEQEFHYFGYSAFIPVTPLAAGQYLLSIVNNTSADANDNWVWLSSTRSGGFFVRGFDSGPWVPNNLFFNLAFQLTDDLAPSVPEPAALGILVGGLVALALRTRRRR